MPNVPRAASPAAVVIVLGSLVTWACSSAPSIDEQLGEHRREPHRLRPIEGIREVRFEPAGAMYAAAELIRGAAGYYARFTDLGFDAVKSKDVETAITRDAHWLGRYNVEMLAWCSGMGLVLPDAQARLASLLRASGLSALPIRNPLPVYLPFASGDPHFTRAIDLGAASSDERPDAATLRFDPSRMDRTIRPDTVAYTMLAEVELGRALLLTTAGGENGGASRPERNGEDAFRALLLLTLASEKARAMNESFFSTVGLRKPPSLFQSVPVFGSKTAEARYLPHRLSLENSSAGGAPLRLAVMEPISYLGDLAAVLLAASELAGVSEPSDRNPLARWFAPSGPLPPQTHEQARTLARSALRAIADVHDARDQKAPVSFVSARERGTALRTADAGVLALALERYRAHVERGAPEVEALERKLHAFLLRSQYFDGCYTAMCSVETLDAVEPRVFSAATQGFAIRGLLAAFEATGEFEYRRAAVRAQRYLDETLWMPEQRLYKSEEVIASGTKFSRYRPVYAGSVASALRELSVSTREPSYASRYAEFVTGLARSGLLLSELAPTGETSPDVMDLDADGVLNAPFAGGPFGVAPVFAAEVTRSTP
jgi:hypothetical protein